MFGGLLVSTAAAEAQPLGTFRWQQQPYCNVITLNVVQDGTVYHLYGADDQCGSPRRASAVGMAFVNPDGSIGIGLTLVTNDGGAVGGPPLHIDATVSLATISGTWRDSTGLTGAWTLAPGGGSGGSPRPVPSAVTIAPNSVGTAALVPGAVTADKLAPSAVTGASVLDGSLSMADLEDAPRIAASATAGFSALTGTPLIVRAVTIAVPTAGRILANATGSFYLGDGFIDHAECAISRTADILPPLTTTHHVSSGTVYVPFANTAMFVVSPGSVTLNLVCREFQGDVSVVQPSLTAIFVPGSW
jgi:hypothetical protein